MTTIKRNLTIGVNVKEAGNLPKVGRHLAAFLKTVDHDHGPFEINITLSVEPTVDAEIGPIELPVADDNLPPEVEVVYLVSGEREEDED